MSEERKEKVDAWSTYREVSEAIHQDVKSAVDAYSFYNSRQTSNIGIPVHQAANVKRAILKVAKRLQYEVRISESHSKLDEISERWDGKDGFVKRLERANIAEEHPGFLSDMVDDILVAAFRLGYTQPGNVETESRDPEEQDEEDARAMFD